ncbi:ABC transporter permease [Planctomycetota bacterium]
MRLPLLYSFRNLKRRPWRTAMTIAGITVVVFAAVIMMALSRGLFTGLDVTGDPENLLVISRKGQNVMFSSIPEEETVYLWALEGVAFGGVDNDLLVSPEIMHMSLVEVNGYESSKHKPVNVRGVQKFAFDVHNKVVITEGNLPENEYDILVGSMSYAKIGVPPEALSVGNTIRFENKVWNICGIFKAGGAIIESELWVREEDLMTVMKRRSHTFVVVRFEDQAKMESALKEFRTSGTLERYFKGWSEKDYYREFTKSLNWVFWLSVFMVGAITLAGALIGINTMYTTIITRMDEIATQRILGFNRWDIAFSLLIESLSISLISGILGAGFGLIVNGIPMKMSLGAFFLTVDTVVIIYAIGLSLFIGIIGALLPVVKGLRLSIVEALHYE